MLTDRDGPQTFQRALNGSP